jgi:hypothetical protein
LRLIPKGATDERVVPYEQISTIRLDLGPSRIGQAVVGFLGTIVVGSFTAFAVQESGREDIGLIAGAGSGAYLGYKLGGRQRNWLMIEVRQGVPEGTKP